jgi:uncharacterized membrane protein YfcA
MDIIHMLIIFAVGLVVSVMGTLIGGSSVFTIPTLLLLGVPPHTAIGTDRFGIMGITISGWYQFHRKGLVDYRTGVTLAVPLLFGSFIGANLVFQVSESVLKLIIIVISLLSLLFLLTDPTRGIEKKRRVIGKREYLIGAFMALIVGVYVGFYGAMGGTLVLYILIFWFGQTFLEAAGTLKIGAFIMNCMAACVFAYRGAIEYSLALPMFAGCFIGSWFGAYYADKIGNVWIKRLFILLLFLMILKLVF